MAAWMALSSMSRTADASGTVMCWFGSIVNGNPVPPVFAVLVRKSELDTAARRWGRFAAPTAAPVLHTIQLDANFVCSVNWAFAFFFGCCLGYKRGGLDAVPAAGRAGCKHVELPGETGDLSELADAD